MNHNQITIAVDAMGGNNSPDKVIKGCEIFLKLNNDSNLVIFGDKNLVDNNLIKDIIKFVI